jgi:hypothetical protein
VPGHSRQLIASLLVAFAIAAITVVLVTARLGPDFGGERDDHGGHHGRGGDREQVDR